MTFFLISLVLLQTPQSIITKIGVDQKVGAQIDPSIPFRDETGRSVKIGDLFGAKPILLTPVYFECPMLCSMQLNGLVRAMHVIPFTAGTEFEIITFSIDPNETPASAAERKNHYVRDYGKKEAVTGWRFLTGDAESIRRLTDEIGFRYTYDEPIRQWAHASTLVVLMPDGRISQYFHGIEYDPNDLKYALIKASEGRIGTIIDHALLFCYQYDPHTGKHSLAIIRLVRIGGAATVLAVLAFMILGSRGKEEQPARAARKPA